MGSSAASTAARGGKKPASSPAVKNLAKSAPSKPQPTSRVARPAGPPTPLAATTTTRSAPDADEVGEVAEEPVDQTAEEVGEQDEQPLSPVTSTIRRTVIATPILGAARKAAAAAAAGETARTGPETVAVGEAPAEPAETVEPQTTEAEPEPESEPRAAEPGSESASAPEPVTAAPATTGRAPSGPSTRGVVARPASVKRVASATAPDIALSVRGLTKAFGDVVAVDSIDLTVNAGSFFGFVGPNGAGKTTTLSMVTGLLRPDDGVVQIYGVDVWANAAVAKKSLGVLPDRLRLFDRLTGSEFLHHAGALRGLDRKTIANRVLDLERAFGIEHSASRLVSDYSAGMVKKIAIAAAMIHSPRLLVLDEPFESVDPVSGQVIIDILKKFAAAGGTVVLSSHSMDLIERVCDAVAIIAEGRVLASGPMEEVLDGQSLEQRFVELAGGATAVEGMEWLQSFSD